MSNYMNWLKFNPFVPFTLTVYQHNAWGEVKQLSSPDTGVSKYQFDTFGNPIQLVNANQQTTDYGYDALYRLTSIDYEGAVLDVTLNYDEGQNGNNRLTSVTDGSGSSHFEYDDRGLVLKADMDIEGLLQAFGNDIFTTIFHE